MLLRYENLIDKCVEAVLEGGSIKEEVEGGLIFLIKSQDKELLTDTGYLNTVVITIF